MQDAFNPASLLCIPLLLALNFLYIHLLEIQPGLMEHPDQKYINALSSNDPIILEELYRKFFGKISEMIVHNSGTATDAADIFQEALLSLFYKTKAQNFILTCPLEAFL